ncbi:uncharacterized protein LOC122074166 [Macadamia integrifolia]|uniref:uncharacterized protein LOC122074166 n=1 Tax=Macadamia integrifolia TaxID=60698 RepID=UPI001C4E80DE|nr:uncharacterized protein LOC122074166 [Macadamia integrifolia]
MSSSSSSSHETPKYIIFFLLMVMSPIISSNVINFQSPNLFPIGFAWNPTSQHFILSSLRHHSLKFVSDGGIVETLISDHSLPPMVTILGITIDSINNRLLAIIHAFEPLPPFNALAAYDLTSGDRLFLTPLTNSLVTGRRPIAIDVAIDFSGNAYVTNSVGNFIWKVEASGKPFVLSKSAVFSSQHVDTRQPYSFSGLSGIAYVSNGGFLLVVQTNTGKLFKVHVEDGTARVVRSTEELTAAEGIAVRNDGIVVVMSEKKAWFLKSKDGWDEAVVYDEIALDADKLPTSVTVREENRTYVLYGKARKGSLGSTEKTEFSIEEITGSSKGKKEEPDVNDAS